MRHLIQVPKGLTNIIIMYLILYLIIILTLFIYNLTGIYLIIPFWLSILTYIISSINLLIDYNNSNVLRFIQLISLGFIIIVLILNIKILIFRIFI
jgi:hypothetical protein